jgi:hypothetical protein
MAMIRYALTDSHTQLGKMLHMSMLTYGQNRRANNIITTKRGT